MSAISCVSLFSRPLFCPHIIIWTSTGPLFYLSGPPFFLLQVLFSWDNPYSCGWVSSNKSTHVSFSLLVIHPALASSTVPSSSSAPIWWHLRWGFMSLHFVYIHNPVFILYPIILLLCGYTSHIWHKWVGLCILLW